MKNQTIFIYCVIALFAVSSAKAGWTSVSIGGQDTILTSISGSNIIGYTGSASYPIPQNYLYNGTSWTALTDYPFSSSDVFARRIDNGNIVGYMGHLPQTNGFIYNGTSWTQLMVPNTPYYNWTTPLSINGSNIVGYYTIPWDSSATRHGFLYNGTTWTTIDNPEATYTAIYDIDGGNIVGTYTHADKIMHSFLYDGTNWTTLDMPGAIETFALGIDGSNIVGYYRDNPDDVTSKHGFLYDGTNWTTLDMPEGYNTAPKDIDGNKIVGSYNAYPDRTFGFIYTIPEPATVCLLAFGLILIRRK